MGSSIGMEGRVCWERLYAIVVWLSNHCLGS